jgi:hypothetical protein
MDEVKSALYSTQTTITQYSQLALPTIAPQMVRAIPAQMLNESLEAPEESLFIGGDSHGNPSSIDAFLVSDNDLGLSEQESKPADYKQSISKLALNSGNALVHPSTNTTVQTPFGNIFIAAGSVVLIMTGSKSISIFNLHDEHQDAVTINVGEHKLSLAPGKQSTIAPQSVDSFNMINPAESFGYRSLTKAKLDGALQVFTSEFSLPVTLLTVKPLRQLMLSSNQSARRLASRILKTTAIVQHMHSGVAGYELMPHPYATAMR